jgi:hypothetical protein
VNGVGGVAQPRHSRVVPRHCHDPGQRVLGAAGASTPATRSHKARPLPLIPGPGHSWLLQSMEGVVLIQLPVAVCSRCIRWDLLPVEQVPLFIKRGCGKGTATGIRLAKTQGMERPFSRWPSCAAPAMTELVLPPSTGRPACV